MNLWDTRPHWKKAFVKACKNFQVKFNMTRILESAQFETETKWENILRPQKFEDFPGQDDVKEKIKVFLQAAKNRKEPLDHTLLFGPPGLGKTTLAQIIANELEVDIKITSAPPAIPADNAIWPASRPITSKIITR